MTNTKATKKPLTNAIASALANENEDGPFVLQVRSWTHDFACDVEVKEDKATGLLTATKYRRMK